MTTVREIVLQHLKSVGADGLCCDGCGCDGTMPCGEYGSQCIPARKTIATDDGDNHEKGDTIYVPMTTEAK